MCNFQLFSFKIFLVSNLFTIMIKTFFYWDLSGLFIYFFYANFKMTAIHRFTRKEN